MAFGFSKTRYSPIAIDFGADSIKLLQVVCENPPQLVAAASSVLPEHARTDAESRRAFLAEALKNLLAIEPFKGRRAMLCIPAFQTLVQHVQLPGVAPSEQQNIDEQVGAQLQQRLNVDPHRLVIRHFPVTQVMRNGVTRQEMICLAASKDVVMQYIELARSCKLDVVGMHSEQLCMVRAFAHLYRRNEDAKRTTCFIDIGAATTKLVIAHGKQMVFAKSIHAAGDQITKRMANARKISFIDARTMRVSGGAGGMGLAAGQGTLTTAGGAGEPDSGLALDPTAVLVAAQVAQADPPKGSDREDSFYAETRECLIDEAQLCLRHYHGLFPDRSIEKLVFLGGESHHKKMCQSIAKALRITAQLGDPFARLVRISKTKQPTGVDIDQAQPGWAVPMGLSLSEANL